MDEDIQDKLLVKLLTNAGHTVATVNQAGLMGQSDLVVLNYAQQQFFCLLTYNCQDFKDLHDQGIRHCGILAVYRDTNPTKDINFKSIVKAIANLEAASIPLANQFISLNHWNY
ncbi:MAG: DUF5615 family PIN-like protein [Crocosphaera sp.]|nr:DUF5615 family PIN-like protein [Crocosphaera sp.]